MAAAPDDGAISLRMALFLAAGLAVTGLLLAIHLVDKWPR